MPIRPLMPRKNLSDVQNPATALANLGGQPADADLTAIAALTTQSFGRSVLTTADAPSLRALAGALGGSLGATDNRLLRSDGTGGATAQGSAVTVDDSGNVSGVVTLSATTGIISSGYVLAFGSGAALNYNGASIKLPGSAAIAWGASLEAAWRTRLYESAAGVLTVDNGSGGSAALAITGNLIASGTGTFASSQILLSTVSTLPAIWLGAAAVASPGTSNYALLRQAGVCTVLNTASGEELHFRVANSNVVVVSSTGATVTGTLAASGLTIGDAGGYPYLSAASTGITFGKSGTAFNLFIAATTSGRIGLGNNSQLGWSSSSDPSGTQDTYFQRSAAGACALTGKLSVTSTVTVGASTFAALPSASANTGAILRVTDRGQKLVHSDGTDWRFVHDNTIAS